MQETRSESNGEWGSWLMSTGLIYVPGKYSPTEEIIEIQKVIAKYGGIYTSHMRSESTEILEAIDEALRIGKEADCRVEISHFKVGADCLENGGEVIVGKVVKARNEGQDVWADQYPYTASSTGISVIFPNWVLEKGYDHAKEILQDESIVKQIIEELIHKQTEERHFEDFSYVVIASSRAYPDYTGLDLKKISQIQKWEKQIEEKLNLNDLEKIKLPPVTWEDQIRTIIDIYLKGGASCVYHTQSEENVKTIMKAPFVSICSDSGVRVLGEGKPHPRGYGSNARVLGKYVREEKVIPLEEAIRKMTSLPAQVFKFSQLGLIREGYQADLTIFDPETVIDKATFEDPHQYSEGINHVIVNGKIVFSNGAFTGRLPGKVLYGPGKK